MVRKLHNNAATVVHLQHKNTHEERFFFVSHTIHNATWVVHLQHKRPLQLVNNRYKQKTRCNVYYTTWYTRLILHILATLPGVPCYIAQLPTARQRATSATPCSRLWSSSQTLRPQRGSEADKQKDSTNFDKLWNARDKEIERAKNHN